MKFVNRARLTGAASALVLSACLAQANAATVQAPAAQAEDDTETIVVTARLRSEALQDVPGQVTAFTAADIEARGITKPIDFINAVPNVTFVETQNAGTSFLVIRGISQARNSEPSAAIVVDGVPMTQPAQFNQELVDIQQIEVLKGPQGALYGRNAIGGAIVITSKKPTDEWEARFTAGYESGPGGKGQAVVSGPLASGLKVRAAVSYFDTEGHLTNVNPTADLPGSSAKKDVDPVENLNARLSFLFEPNDNFEADLRLSMDLLKTRALYYVIDDFGSPTFNDPNFVDRPIDLNNSGKNDRKIYDAALKLSYDTEAGTFTSITGYNSVWEILTGDGYPFDPFDPPGVNRLGFNFSQSQFLDVQTFTQELRFTSPEDRRFRWIAGGQIFKTDRFISTGNMFDIADEGVLPEYRTPFPPVFGPHGSISFLADSQDQFAWAAYIDTSYNLTEDLELSVNLRYDRDTRENTTETPQVFLDANVNPPLLLAGLPPTLTGDKREHTWDDWQPQVILRWQALDDLNLYASYSRGFRSGGFNQTGVGAAAIGNFDNVGDLFEQETADTYEVGFKSQWWDNRLTFNGSGYYTQDKGGYYFLFIASNSTQNLGNIPETEYMGFDLDLTARLTQELTVNAAFGYTDSEITSFPVVNSFAPVEGAKAPLVSDYTFNLGVQYYTPIANGVNGLIRLDYSRIGDTTFVIPLLVPAAPFFIFEPTPIQRDPVDLVDLRAGIDGESWSITFWSKNLFDVKYNTEYSTGGFLFKAQPMRWGVDLTKRF